MPIFNDHIKNLFSKFLERIAKHDDDIFNKDFKYDIVETNSPEDIATFLN